MEDWQKKVSEYETEKDLQKQCEDYLAILQRQGKVWYWHDKTNDTSLFNSIMKLFNRSNQTETGRKLDELLRLHRNRGGLPDLVVWMKKHRTRYKSVRVITFELKSPKGGGILTPGQKDFMEFLSDSQHSHHILNAFEIDTDDPDAFEGFKNIIDGLFK